MNEHNFQSARKKSNARGARKWEEQNKPKATTTKSKQKKIFQTPEFSSVRKAKTFHFTVFKTEVLRQMLRYELEAAQR